jgi:hypothetical protein
VEGVGNVRGSILDVFYFGATAIGIIFLGYILYGVIGQTTPIGYQVASQMNASNGMNLSNATIAITQTQVAINNFLGVVPLVIGGMGIAAIMLAAFIPTSPIFLPAGILLLLVAAVIFYNFQQALPAVFNSAFFLPATTAYPLPATIANNIVWLVLIIGAAVLVVMYGRTRGAGTPEG